MSTTAIPRTTGRRAAWRVASMAVCPLAAGVLVRAKARARGYPAWRDCRCVFRTETVFSLVLASRHTAERQELRVLTVSDPPLLIRRLLHHLAQAGAVLLTPLGLGGARWVRREDVPGLARQRLDGSPALRQAGRGRRVRLERIRLALAAATGNPGGATPLPIFREPHSGRLVAKPCCAGRAPAGTRIDVIGWSSSQISYCTARLHPR